MSFHEGTCLVSIVTRALFNELQKFSATALPRHSRSLIIERAACLSSISFRNLLRRFGSTAESSDFSDMADDSLFVSAKEGKGFPEEGAPAQRADSSIDICAQLLFELENKLRAQHSPLGLA